MQDFQPSARIPCLIPFRSYILVALWINKASHTFQNVIFFIPLHIITLRLMNKIIFKILCSFCLCLLMASCQLDRSFFRSPNPNTIKIARFDRAVEDYLTTGNFASWQKLNTDYPQETRALVEDVLHLGSVESELIEDTLRTFYEDSTLVKLRKDVGKTFEDLSDYEKKLSNAFKRLSAECPDFVTPHVYAQNSALNQSIVVGDSLLGISLDKYMGANYPIYQKYFYDNQRATMEPQRIVQDCLSFYLAQQYILPQMKKMPRPNLLQCMIHQGKIAWVVAKLTDHPLLDIAAVLPSTKKWYTRHEQQVWDAINHPQLLGSTDSVLIQSVVMTNTKRPYFTDTHSRGVGLWVGMRIVDEYMKHNPKVSINTLLHTTDYNRLLRNSLYLKGQANAGV